MPAPSLYIPLALCALAFLFGAVPYGFLVGRAMGVDIREHGSKNIGATNILRVLGTRAGAAVLVLDALKGWLPVFVAARLLAAPGGWLVAVGLAAILGHIYSPFVRFKGGKGVATALGVLIGLNPVVAFASVAVFAATVALTRYVSLGSILGAVAECTLFWVLPHPSLATPVFGTVVAVFVIARHRANLARLRAGTESKWGEKAAG